jgi:hypothetical protein
MNYFHKILYRLLIISSAIFSNSNLFAQQINDYRDPFIGDYYGYVLETEWSVYDTIETRDTIEGLINVSKFLGYTLFYGSYYIDIEHKIGITYAPYSHDYDDSGCSWTIYYTDGFLHPTISPNGILTYPELIDCENGSLIGYCNGDSISIIYYNYNQWGGFKNIIRGKRTAASIDNPELTGLIFQVMPNPCLNELSILGINIPIELSISDLQGKIHISKTIVDNKVNVSQLAPGLYFLTIKNRYLNCTFKFIKDNAR